jgi:hypothetical protein
MKTLYQTVKKVSGTAAASMSDNFAGAVLGVATAMSERHDRISHRPPTDRGSDGDDFARNLESRQLTRVCRERIESLALQNVGPVDACSCNPDEYVSVANLGNRFCDVDEDLGATGLVDSDGSHRVRNRHKRVCPVG